MYGYAVIKGHQYRIVPGEEIKVPQLEINEGGQFDISPILMLNDGKEVMFGSACAGFIARATVLSHGRDNKITVFKKKRRKGYKVSRGHRQGFTAIRINEIVKTEEK